MGRDEAASAYGNGSGDDQDQRRARRLRLIAIATGAGLVLLLAAAVGVYAYDNSRKDQIAEGVKVGSVDVGGLDRDEAARVLRNQLIEPLRKPLKVRFNDSTFKLPAEKLKVHADLDEMLNDAIEVSQEGGLPGRMFRYVTGGSVDERIDADVAYSTAAVDRFVDGIADEVNQDAQDASVSATGSSLDVVPAQNGRALKGKVLRREIAAELDGARDSKPILARAVRTKPDVSTAEVESRYPVYLTLDRANFTLHFWRDLKLAKSYTVAVGQVGFDTPTGLYHIQNKAVDPAWSVPNAAWAGSLAGTVVPGGVPENPLKERWMGIYDGAGIHGTDQTYSLGSAASHGCVRMSIPDVIELYDQVPVGTPMYIG